MPSKKILILPFAVSIISHALLLSATGLVDFGHGSRNKEDAFTVDLRKVEELKEAKAENENVKDGFPQLNSMKAAKNNGLPEETVSLNSSDKRYAPYLIKIKKKIGKIWSYPRQASERKKEGTTKVRFSLDKNGKLVESRIVSSSGHDLLDREALDVVRAAAPYEPFPININLSRLHILAAFHYRLLK
ncbi:MAG: energy transducer TonB [Syntrophales bacterium]|nr:energy transducer TonB [Syntrophales bacterium]